MEWNLLYQITAAQIPILSVLSSTEFVEPPPPEQNSWVPHFTQSCPPPLAEMLPP